MVMGFNVFSDEEQDSKCELCHEMESTCLFIGSGHPYRIGRLLASHSPYLFKIIYPYRAHAPMPGTRLIRKRNYGKYP
jgi:hypothetical protein